MMDFRTLLSSSYIARYLVMNAPNITDYRYFPERPVENAPPLFTFSSPLDRDAARIRNVNFTGEALEGTDLDQFLIRTGTTAFLIIQNDRLITEQYLNGYTRSSINSSFSVAKSFASALVGIALAEKHLHSLDDPVTRYLPELKGCHWSAITLRHLVSMSSGLAYHQEGFFPWSDQPKVYYSLNLRKLASQAQKQEEPGCHFHYNNYNLLLLGMILERATGGHVATYLQEKLWKRIGMEFPATWSLDSEADGLEKMESGINARAVDFARFGRLHLRKGDWEGQQVVPESWVVESTTLDANPKWTNYKYLWWIPGGRNDCFMAVGNLGQFLFVAPHKDLVILRLGKRGGVRGWQRVFPRIFMDIADQM